MAPPPEKVAPRRLVVRITLTDRREDLDRCQNTADAQGQDEGRPAYALPSDTIWGLGQVCAVRRQAGGRLVSIPIDKSLRVRRSSKSIANRSIDPQTGKILNPGRFEDIEYADPVKPMPSNFNTTLTEEHMKRTEVGWTLDAKLTPGNGRSRSFASYQPRAAAYCEEQSNLPRDRRSGAPSSVRFLRFNDIRRLLLLSQMRP